MAAGMRAADPGSLAAAEHRQAPLALAVRTQARRPAGPKPTDSLAGKAPHQGRLAAYWPSGTPVRPVPAGWVRIRMQRSQGSPTGRSIRTRAAGRGTPALATPKTNLVPSGRQRRHA